MNTIIQNIKETLTTQCRELFTHIKQSEAVLANEKIQLEKLQAALNALGGGSHKAKPTKNSKPSPTKLDVLNIFIPLLRENGGSLALEDLDAITRHKLKEEQGKCLNGIALRVNEALKDPRIVQATPGVISLRETANQKAVLDKP